MRALVTGVAGFLLLMLTGCSAAQDTVNKASDAAKSAAATEVQQQVEKKICDLVQDQKLSDSDRQKLSSLLDQAKQLNLPDEFLEPAQKLADKGADAKSDLEDLRARCDA